MMKAVIKTEKNSKIFGVFLLLLWKLGIYGKISVGENDVLLIYQLYPTRIREAKHCTSPKCLLVFPLNCLTLQGTAMAVVGPSSFYIL